MGEWRLQRDEATSGVRKGRAYEKPSGMRAAVYSKHAVELPPWAYVIQLKKGVGDAVAMTIDRPVEAFSANKPAKLRVPCSAAPAHP